MLKKVFIVVTMICISLTALADVPEYTVLRTDKGIVLDGILDEDDWARAESVGAFLFPWYDSGDKEQTEVKMLWNDRYLYLAYAVDDKYIWADHYDTNSWTYLDDAVEFFWIPSSDNAGVYYFFEMNAIGNLLCVYDFKNDFLNNKAMVPRIAMNVTGTVNNDSDTDTGWILEIAVRFSDYPELSRREVPQPGDVWWVNLNRCGGETNPQYSQWSPSQTSSPNYHRPEDFGRLVFSDRVVGSPVGVETKTAALPGELSINGNFPNPFNPSTTIEFSLPADGFTELNVYTINNQKIRTLVSEKKTAGSHAVLWDGKDDAGNEVSSGVYITRLRVGDHQATGRMTLVK